ncbi:TetR/AcrR family transcriptional regulator [Pontibacter sp. 172403-2]|uniref:TetR/AcrR family transcriptional regulator n=1 Tax=Pontibacter rufus TaxID=2791028 RepID=UPI0018AFE4E9|nr:TetR/AcrR family transcriptional regulator [Pontibacter sp. 172403-2]MBF9254696.1 TetR/AcrR family transcriptional regulator [Pontibacter sp. 172403-2]
MTKEDKRKHILDTAEKMFAAFGYEGASTRQLASEAGVNMAMLNYYFGSKESLLQAVLERRIAGMRNQLEEAKEVNASAWEKLNRALEIYLNRVSANNSFHRIIYREISLNQRSTLSYFLSENVFRNVQTIMDIIREGIQDSSFRKVDVEMTAASILGTIYYLLNSEQVAARLLDTDFQDQAAVDTEIKPRIKKFLHDYLQAYLMHHDSEKQ